MSGLKAAPLLYSGCVVNGGTFDQGLLMGYRATRELSGAIVWECRSGAPQRFLSFHPSADEAIEQAVQLTLAGRRAHAS